MKLILLFIALLQNLLLYVQCCLKTAENGGTYTYLHTKENMIANFVEYNPNIYSEQYENISLKLSQKNLLQIGEVIHKIFGCSLFCKMDKTECLFQYMTYIDDVLKMNHLYVNLEENCKAELTQNYNNEQCKVISTIFGLEFRFSDMDGKYIKFETFTPNLITYYYKGKDRKSVSIKNLVINEEPDGLTLSLFTDQHARILKIIINDKESTCHNFPFIENYFLCNRGSFKERRVKNELDGYGRLTNLPNHHYYDQTSGNTLSRENYIGVEISGSDVIVKFSKNDSVLSYVFNNNSNEKCIEKVNYLLMKDMNICKEGYVYSDSIHYYYNPLDMFFPHINHGCMKINLIELEFYYLNNIDQQNKIITIKIKNVKSSGNTFNIIGLIDHTKPFYYSFHIWNDKPTSKLLNDMEIKYLLENSCNFDNDDFILTDESDNSHLRYYNNNNSGLWFVKAIDDGKISYTDGLSGDTLLAPWISFKKMLYPEYSYIFYVNGYALKKNFFTQNAECSAKFNSLLINKFKCDVVNKIFYTPSKGYGNEYVTLYDQVGIMSVHDFDNMFKKHILYETIEIVNPGNDYLKLVVSGYDLTTYANKKNLGKKERTTEEITILSNEKCESFIKGLVEGKKFTQIYRSEFLGYKLEKYYTDEELKYLLSEYKEPEKANTEIGNVLKYLEKEYSFGNSTKDAGNKANIFHFVYLNYEYKMAIHTWFKITHSDSSNVEETGTNDVEEEEQAQHRPLVWQEARHRDSEFSKKPSKKRLERQQAQQWERTDGNMVHIDLKKIRNRKLEHINRTNTSVRSKVVINRNTFTKEKPKDA
jgi:hypothetical protein